MQPKKQIDRNTIIYLVNEITKHQGVKNVPRVKLGRLMYLLWLEYASLQPRLSFPENSPMANMRFINYERGPAEDIIDEYYDEIQAEILSGHIPEFSQTEFMPKEKIFLNHATETVRNCYSGYRTEDLCYFIQHRLPTCLHKPKITELIMSKREFIKEVHAYKRKRRRLK
jgi:hypothetical protein